MNKSRFTFLLTLAALLGGGLVLPNAASAHERSPSYQMERGHHNYYDRHDQHDHQQTPYWYLQRHYEARPYVYRPRKRIHRLHHNHKGHHKGHHQPHGHQHRRQHHRDVSPVRLEIGYEIVL